MPVGLIQLAGLTWTDPALAFRQLLALRLPPAAIWQATIVMAVLLVAINLLPGPMPVKYAADGLPAPFVQFALQLLFLVVPAVMMQAIGHAFGRTAALTDCLLAINWAQFVVLPIQALFALTLYRASGLAGGFVLVLIIATLWFLTVFVTELFGYGSRTRVLLALLVAMMLISAIAQSVVPPGMI
jgi:hypothetical protein